MYISDRIIEAEVQFPLSKQADMDSEVKKNLTQLGPEIPWGERQIAAKRLGNLKEPIAIPGLLAALQTDKFWMVRCAIIQALEKIADPCAIPVLVLVSQQDSFQVVRSYASKAIERLS
jgi:HEAT repeat protein